MARFTRRQVSKAIAATAGLAAAGRLGVVGAQGTSEGLVLARPIRGRLRPGGTAQYTFDYPGDGSVYYVEMQVMPDAAGARAGFRVFAPNGTTQVIAGYQGGLQPNVAANVISTTRGTYLLQVYNDNQGLAADYWLRVRAGRVEGQNVVAATNIAQSAAAPMVAYVGTYTGNGGGAQRPVAEQKYGQGIKAFRLDPATGNLALIQELPTLGNPAFQAVDPTQRYLVSVHGGDVSRISSYAIDAGGRLSYISDQSSNGTNPAFISVSADGRWVLVADYTGGAIAAYMLDDAGRLSEATDVVKHTGGPGPHPNQNAPHPHQIVWDPDGRYVFVCDLGLDKVFSYKLTTAGKFVANDPPFAELPPGSGPRHLAFHPNGQYAYVVSELKSTLTTCTYDATKGALTPIQTVSTVAPDFKDPSAAAEVIVAPSGQFVYTSTRWADVLTTYTIDQSSGKVTPIAWTPAGVRTPREFAMDPTGSYVYAMGLDSDTINTFSVDAATGKLAETGQVVQANSPVCMTFSKV